MRASFENTIELHGEDMETRESMLEKLVAKAEEDSEFRGQL